MSYRDFGAIKDGHHQGQTSISDGQKNIEEQQSVGTSNQSGEHVTDDLIGPMDYDTFRQTHKQGQQVTNDETEPSAIAGVVQSATGEHDESHESVDETAPEDAVGMYDQLEQVETEAFQLDVLGAVGRLACVHRISVDCNSEINW